MPTLTTLAVFSVAALALLLIPGPVVLFTMARSIEQGWRAGLVSVVAAGVGDGVHVLAAALGLSALILSSALAFEVVKYAGAGYLIYLGIVTLRAAATTPTVVEHTSASAARVFIQALTVTVLNPKTALFFLAFLPQFVDAAQGAMMTQILVLGGLFVALGIVTNSGYAFVAGSARALFQRKPHLRHMQQRLAGVVYIVLGIGTALAGGSKGK